MVNSTTAPYVPPPPPRSARKRSACGPCASATTTPRNQETGSHGSPCLSHHEHKTRRCNTSHTGVQLRVDLHQSSLRMFQQLDGRTTKRVLNRLREPPVQQAAGRLSVHAAFVLVGDPTDRKGGRQGSSSFNKLQAALKAHRGLHPAKILRLKLCPAPRPRRCAPMVPAPATCDNFELPSTTAWVNLQQQLSACFRRVLPSAFKCFWFLAPSRCVPKCIPHRLVPDRHQRAPNKVSAWRCAQPQHPMIDHSNHAQLPPAQGASDAGSKSAEPRARPRHIFPHFDWKLLLLR